MDEMCIPAEVSEQKLNHTIGFYNIFGQLDGRLDDSLQDNQ